MNTTAPMIPYVFCVAIESPDSRNCALNLHKLSYISFTYYCSLEHLRESFYRILMELIGPHNLYF